MNKLIVFGVGDILLKDGATPFVDILGLMGKWGAANKIQEEYERRKEKGPWGLVQYAELCRGIAIGELTMSTREYLPEQIRDGVQSTLHTLKDRGYIIGAISAYPDFVMNVLKDILNLDFAAGTVFEYDGDKATGRLTSELHRNNKYEILKELSRNFRVTADCISIVANSITQVALIEKVGRYVAFNQSRELGYKPDLEILDGDFSKLLEVFR